MIGTVKELWVKKHGRGQTSLAGWYDVAEKSRPYHLAITVIYSSKSSYITLSDQPTTYTHYSPAHLWMSQQAFFWDKKKSVLPRSASFLSSIHKLSQGERKMIVYYVHSFFELNSVKLCPLRAKTLSFFMLGRWCAHFWSHSSTKWAK